MVTVEESVTKGNSTVGLIVAVLLIIALQTAALIPLTSLPLGFFVTTDIVILPTNVPYLLAYFTLPLIYYISASLLLNPKRIVSPFYAQIGTIAVIVMMLTFRAATGAIYTSAQMMVLIQNLASTIFAWGILLGEVGFMQLLFVRWIVGSSLDSLDRGSYLFEGKSSHDMIALLGKSFLKTYHFEKPRQQGSVWITKRFDSLTKSSLVIAVGEQKGNPKNCIIATVAFRRGIYVVKRDQPSSDIRDEILGNIMGKLLAIDPKTKSIKVPEDKLDDDASVLAYEEACDVTISKLGTVSEKARAIPLYYKILIGATLLSLIGLSLAQLLEYGSFTELLASLVVALALEIGLPLREELKERLKKTSEDTD